MSLPAPRAQPDPQIARVITDVNAIAGEHGTPAAYFRQQGIDYGSLVAAVQPRALMVGELVHRAMVDDSTGLIPADCLTVALAAELQRGIAYGLELARRRTP